VSLAALHSGRCGEICPGPGPFAGRCPGDRAAEPVSAPHGARHRQAVIAESETVGHLAPRAHSYEESYDVLDGELELCGGDAAASPPEGGFGHVEVDHEHAGHIPGNMVVRWLSINTAFPPGADPLDDLPMASAAIATRAGHRLSEGLIPTTSTKIAAYSEHDMTRLSVPHGGRRDRRPD
jgi:hypothetical protein